MPRISPKERFQLTTLSASGGSSVRRAVEECRKIHCPAVYSMRIWQTLSVPAGCEESAGRRLQERRIPSYFPRIRCSEQRWGGTDIRVFFPGLIFAAMTEDDRNGLAGSIFIEEMEKNRSGRRPASVQADIQFMAFAEKLNCFCPFRSTETVPPPPSRGIPGCDYAELRGEDGDGYILLLPGRNTDQVFFRFDSVNRKIAFEIPKNLFMTILNLT